MRETLGDSNIGAISGALQIWREVRKLESVDHKIAKL